MSLYRQACSTKRSSSSRWPSLRHTRTPASNVTIILKAQPLLLFALRIPTLTLKITPSGETLRSLGSFVLPARSHRVSLVCSWVQIPTTQFGFSCDCGTMQSCQKSDSQSYSTPSGRTNMTIGLCKPDPIAITFLLIAILVVIASCYYFCCRSTPVVITAEMHPVVVASASAQPPNQNSALCTTIV